MKRSVSHGLSPGTKIKLSHKSIIKTSIQNLYMFRKLIITKFWKNHNQNFKILRTKPLKKNPQYIEINGVQQKQIQEI